MKLTVLGGAAAGGNTGVGCTGFLVQDGQTSVTIDLGPGTLLELRKHIDYRSLDAIVISHYHLDHILDLGALQYLICYNPESAHRKVDLWIPPGTRQRFSRWTEAFSNGENDDFLGQAFSVAEYDPSRTLSLGSLHFSFAATVHPEPAWAMRVSTGSGRDLGFTADTGPAADLASFFSGVGLLISEASENATPEPDSPARGHLTPAEAGELARNAHADALMLTHLWEEYDIGRAVEDASLAFGKPALIARPGLMVAM